MEFYYNFASTSTSIAMIGALLSFAGVGLLILAMKPLTNIRFSSQYECLWLQEIT